MCAKPAELRARRYQEVLSGTLASCHPGYQPFARLTGLCRPHNDPRHRPGHGAVPPHVGWCIGRGFGISPGALSRARPPPACPGQVAQARRRPARRRRHPRPLHADPLRSPMQATRGAGDQHPSLDASELQGRPSLLPGLRTGVKLVGATRSLRNGRPQRGPIIEQTAARVDHSMTAEDVAALGRDTECLALGLPGEITLDEIETPARSAQSSTRVRRESGAP
jgi:hypothetical protein